MKVAARSVLFCFVGRAACPVREAALLLTFSWMDSILGSCLAPFCDRAGILIALIFCDGLLRVGLLVKSLPCAPICLGRFVSLTLGD